LNTPLQLTVSRILHAGYVFECAGTSIAFDPIVENPFSRNCYPFPDVRFDHAKLRALRFDAVFISHFHDDHLSLDSLDFLDRATPIYLYCLFDELFEMIRALGFTEVHPLQTRVPVQIGPIEVIPREALDNEVDSMFQIRAAGLNILNVVDAWIDPAELDDMAKDKWDMVLWPFQTMREIEVISPSRAAPAPLTLPEDWIEQLTILNPRYVVPSSCQFLQEPWSWYNHAFFPITYRQFQQEIEAALPASQVVRLNPSVSIVLDQASLQFGAPLDWVIPVGDQDVDYPYQPDHAIPPTSDIARHFLPLSEAQSQRVVAFCESGILDKYRDQELEPGGYFDQARHWRLCIYDHQGQATEFHYRVEGDTIERCEAIAPGWTTDIPIQKLYAALELGESLTSMYVRINDTVFDDETELEIRQAQVLDDPLIRCLYDNEIGSYQAAQLRRLSGREVVSG
jgi:hypothetical protein